MKSIINKKSAFGFIMALIISYIFTINYSVAIYANSYEDITVKMQPGNIISSISINNIESPLYSFAENVEELQYENDLLVCKDIYHLYIKKASIDSVCIKFENSNNASIEIKGEEVIIFENTFSVSNNFFEIIKNSISLKSIGILFISLIISFAVIYILFKVLSKIKYNTMGYNLYRHYITHIIHI